VLNQILSNMSALPAQLAAATPPVAAPPAAPVAPRVVARRGLQCPVMRQAYSTNMMAYTCGHILSSWAYLLMTSTSNACPSCPFCRTVVQIHP